MPVISQNTDFRAYVVTDGSPTFMYDDQYAAVFTGDSPSVTIGLGSNHDFIYLGSDNVSLGLDGATNIAVVGWNATDHLVIDRPEGTVPVVTTSDGASGTLVLVPNLGYGGSAPYFDSVDLVHSHITPGQIQFT